MKIIEEPAQQDICVQDMKDGWIGVITAHKRDIHIGKVVQRCDKILVELGKSTDDAFPYIFSEEGDRREDFRIRILPKGTKLEI